MEINQKAWKILTEDEQLALTLKHGHNKSSWEAGEVIGRAHYKYLEVEARAKHFLKMFTEHFLLYDEVIPEWLDLDDRVRKYFKILMVRRRTVIEAVDLISDDYFSIKTFREKLVVEAIEKMYNSLDAAEKNIAQLIVDFDRWNNFRILPREIQEPSAFKRRNKNADIRNIKNLLTLHTYAVEQLIKRYNSKKPGVKVIYVPIFSQYVEPEDSIMRVKLNEDTIANLSKVGLYCFSRVEHAQDFYEMIKEYDFSRKGKNCKYGQKFWPRFRLLTKQSLNYNAIQKRIPSRKYLESALRDLDINLLRPKEKLPETDRKRKRKPHFKND
jgi:hypothetical protein